MTNFKYTIIFPGVKYSFKTHEKWDGDFYMFIITKKLFDYNVKYESYLYAVKRGFICHVVEQQKS